MNKKTGKILLFVVIYCTVLLSEVESFLKIGRELSSNSRSSVQDTVSESKNKQKDSVFLQKDGFQVEPSLKKARRERIKIVQTLRKRYALNRENLREAFDRKIQL